MKTLLSVKVDDNIKAQAQKLAKDLGIPLSTVINANLREFIASRKLIISDLPRLNPIVETELAKIEADIKSGKNISKPISSPKEVSDYLNSL